MKKEPEAKAEISAAELMAQSIHQLKMAGLNTAWLAAQDSRRGTDWFEEQAKNILTALLAAAQERIGILKDLCLPAERRETGPRCTEQEALDWLKEYCGLHENGVVGDAINVIMSHKEGEIGFWLVDAQGNKRRWKEVLAAFANHRASAPAQGQDGWVSVQERLPQPGVNVLVWLRFGKADLDFIYDAPKGGEEWSEWGNKVTHWRELPPSPEPGTGGGAK